ncbi:hypothetical protein [Pandoraea norimbergensis]
MNKLIDATQTYQTDRRYAIRPMVAVKFDVSEAKAPHVPLAYEYITSARFYATSLGPSGSSERMHDHALRAILGMVYGEAVQRLCEIERAAEAGDVMEVINLCEVLREDMLTPTAKDRS